MFVGARTPWLGSSGRFDRSQSEAAPKKRRDSRWFPTDFDPEAEQCIWRVGTCNAKCTGGDLLRLSTDEM